MHGSANARLPEVVARLERYCRDRDWSGHDPYDALNSERFARTPLARNRVARIGLTQLLKRSPVDLRPLLRVTPRADPKGTALFVAAYLQQARRGDGEALGHARALTGRLLSLRSPGHHWCWGYSFPWQTRRELVPQGSPNLVTTVFAANALLDAHQHGLGRDALEAAIGAGRYLAEELYWESGQVASFAYPRPDVHRPVHNANLLAAALLCRLSRITGDRHWVEKALRVARYSAVAQRADGSWFYGESPNQRWIDNFHTGYNLEALDAIDRHLGSNEFAPVVERGFRFYLAHFFTEAGVAKYFHDQAYPIDVHCVAQSLISLRTFAALDAGAQGTADRVLSWALEHLWDDSGFFYYRRLRTLTIRTPYMRWSQAWMFLALTNVMAPRAMRETAAIGMGSSGQSC